ncbi:MAG: 30S ribosomal protein S19 [Candidatus Babeliales bacterium]|jgi:small subunit ribosomal protein S19
MSRSLAKGPYVDPTLAAKIAKVKSSGKREAIKTYKRASMITPEFVGLTIAIHDGRKFASIFITENMVGHKLGEFAPTRTFRVHSGQRKADKEAGAAPSAAPAATSAPAAAASPAKG